MTEYTVRIANNKNVHAIQIDEGIYDTIPNDVENFQYGNELCLNERPGRKHHSYVRGTESISKIYNCLVNAMKEPDRVTFQIPNFMVETETPIEVWKQSGDVE